MAINESLEKYIGVKLDESAAEPEEIREVKKAFNDVWKAFTTLEKKIDILESTAKKYKFEEPFGSDVGNAMETISDECASYEEFLQDFRKEAEDE